MTNTITILWRNFE